jgi:hypothetical protein
MFKTLPLVRCNAAILGLAAAMAITAVRAEAQCPAERSVAMFPTDPQLCAKLENTIRHPSALPLAEFEKQLDQYFGHYCHRNAASGWVRDKYVRDTGPFIATLAGGAWQGKHQGTHAPVIIWYSPEMFAWLKTYRPAESAGPDDPPPIPDGAIMVKEMYPAPAAACRNVDPLKLFPTDGAAIMIRDNGGSHDGWFWGWYGFGPASGWTPDYPPDPQNTLPNMGFAQYCMNCHASAENNLTFASSKNIQDEPGEPLVFLSQNFFTPALEHSQHELVVLPSGGVSRLGEPNYMADGEVVSALRAYAQKMPSWDSVAKMPSQTFDNTWVDAGGPNSHDTFLTSTQCIGCHDAGSTGLQFDMTQPNPHGAGLINLSPFATWRSSPMGLGGRDPIFFAQLASEIQTFHPDSATTVQDTCLGCHGVLGQRQFHIDKFAESKQCPDFLRKMVDAAPWPESSPEAAHANYGMLARDGISCTACHHMVLVEAARAAVADAPQNACIAERQALFNPENSGFARTFTGGFLVGPPDKLIGQFEKPQQIPMKNALGIRPVEDKSISDSEICGTCHTVHLQVLRDGKTLAHVYEQTTYAEWAFSAYRIGSTADGVLPFGGGADPQSCQDCHMTSREMDGSKTVSKIASIQEHSNFPQVESGLGGEDIDLSVRSGFARHTLVGLNVFLVKMAEQFPDVLGIQRRDPMMGSKAVDPLLSTEQAMLDQAAGKTAQISISDLKLSDRALSATVTVTNKAGHKFPSGVGFRRAFITFVVFDQNGNSIWTSGATNAAGALVDENGIPLDGEYWWKDDCTAYARPGERPHQPHFQRITRSNQAQIYQELTSTPPKSVPAPVCSQSAPPQGDLTTSFLSICAEVKDNRILPKGYLPLESRRQIARALGAGDDLADDAGPTAVGDDPDYVTGGADSLTYHVPVADLPKGTRPASVQATLNYQATPPFYLQDRLCTGHGADTERLYFLVSHLNLDETAADGWKLKVVSTERVAIPQ